jgi:predicted RNase H-like nuclease (RuvC/YqgF family)
MVKDTQILIRVSSSQKERWEDHIDENPMYNNITDLIEKSVEEKIAENNSDEATIEDEFDILFEEVETVKNQNADIKNLNEKIERTQARSEELEESMERILNKIDREAGNL